LPLWPIIASDGVSALELVRQRRYDVALLDLMMPGLDGWWRYDVSALELVRQRRYDVALLDLMMPGLDGWWRYSVMLPGSRFASCLGNRST
jgi:CheY-like chemotaxis protein